MNFAGRTSAPIAIATRRFFIVPIFCALTLWLHAEPKYSDWSTPVNLGLIVNSTYDDSLCEISRDQRSLYFASTRPGFGGDDIWVAQRPSEDSPWGAPINLGALINTVNNERAPSLSRDGHLLFFVSDRPGGLGGFDIWVSRRNQTKDDFAWGPPINLGSTVNSTFNDVGPAYLSNDENGSVSLYFSSNRPGGIGGFDIYVSVLAADGSFGPSILVPELSSPLNELRPTVRHDGLEIFFTLGAGTPNTRALMVSKRSTPDEPWGMPEPLGPVVNSAVEDSYPSISADGTTLYFNSNRADPAASGGVDLYKTTRMKLNKL